jgi:hypothetical protein
LPQSGDSSCLRASCWNDCRYGSPHVDFEDELSLMAQLPDGRLITMYSGCAFKESALDGQEQPVYLRFSSDHGSTITGAENTTKLGFCLRFGALSYRRIASRSRMSAGLSSWTFVAPPTCPHLAITPGTGGIRMT